MIKTSFSKHSWNTNYVMVPVVGAWWMRLFFLPQAKQTFSAKSIDEKHLHFKNFMGAHNLVWHGSLGTHLLNFQPISLYIFHISHSLHCLDWEVGQPHSGTLSFVGWMHDKCPNVVLTPHLVQQLHFTGMHTYVL